MENKHLILNRIDNAEFRVNSENGRVDITGIAAHWNSANMNQQIVTERSFDSFLAMYGEGKITPIVNWEHRPDYQIGLIDNISKESDGLWIEAHLNTNIPYVNEWLLPLIEAGDLKGLSTEGYVYGGYDGIIEREDGTYIVKDFILTAVAVTSLPADADAALTVKNYIDEYAALKTPEEEVAKSKWYLFC